MTEETTSDQLHSYFITYDYEGMPGFYHEYENEKDLREAIKNIRTWHQSRMNNARAWRAQEIAKPER